MKSQSSIVPEFKRTPSSSGQSEDIDRAIGPVGTTQALPVDVSQLEDTINELYRVNMNYRNETKFVTRLTNSTKGQLRWYTHELGNKSEGEGDHIRKSPKAEALWKILGSHINDLCKPKNMLVPVSCPEGIDLQLWFHIEKRVHSLVYFMRGRVDTEKNLIAYAKKLPFADWVQSSACPGFSLVNYAKLVGTVRNLAMYKSPSALWKMVGLAPYTKNDVTKACSTWMYEGGLTSKDWIAAAYSPSRRSMMYVAGDCLIKAGGGVEHPEKWTRYSKIYYERKEYEKKKAPLLKPMIHHRRAQRVMEKRLVRDLWVKWRDLLRPQMPLSKAA